MKYFQKWRPNGDPFFVNENGDEVSESVARANLIESRRKAAHVMESRAGRRHITRPTTPAPREQKSAKERLREAFQGMGLSEAEARIASGEVGRQTITKAVEEGYDLLLSRR